MDKRMLLHLNLILFILLPFNYAIGAANELEQIKQAISAKGASWTAGENWVTRLSPEERKRLCGSFLTPPDHTSAPLLSIPLINNLPSTFDWRNNNGNWVTPVKDQAQCGSCWDFSAVGQVEAWWKIYNANLDSMIDLSEQFVLSCSEGSCDGWWPESALSFIQEVGIPDESCFYYTARDQIPCSNACSDWEERAVKIPGWGYITLEEDIIDNIKNAIYRHPVSASFVVYKDFNYYESGVYEHVWGDVEAGHAILIVGWNDEEQSWICKNSWGRFWGEDGYFRIKWSNCGMGTYVPFIWDEITSGPAFAVAPDHFNLSLTYGDSIVEKITMMNSSPNLLQFSSFDYDLKIMFHPDDFMAWDDLSWWCGDPQLGGYGDHWLQYMDTPVLNLSNTVEPRLSWMGAWSMEDPSSAVPPYDGWDGCNVWVSIDSGKTFQVANPITPLYDCQSLWSFGDPEKGWNMGIGIPGWVGNSGGWKPIEFDLSSYKSDNVVIRFALASDMYVSAVTDTQLYGFFVDEIIVSDGQNVLFEDHGDNIYSMKSTCLGPRTNADWIDISNSVGAVSPQDSIPINIIINTRKMIPDVYHGWIHFISNDTSLSSTDVPIYLELKAPEHDVGVDEVKFPGESLVIFSSINLGAEINNYGLNDETDFDVTCNIQDKGQTIYSDTVHVPLLLANKSKLVSFKPFLALQTGALDFIVTLINLSDDYNKHNNFIHSITQVTNLVDGFETETDYWEFEGGWGVTNQLKGHTGDYAVHVNSGLTPYSHNMDAFLTYKPGFDLHLVDKATIKFWTRFNTEKDKDICSIEVSGDNENWIIVDTFSGVCPAWKQREIGLTDLINAGYGNVWIRFHFISDSASAGFGVLIDDFEIYYQNPTDVSHDRINTDTNKDWNLSQNYPNPFNMVTKISYDLLEAGQVTLVIYNIRGQIVRNLLRTHQTPGHYFVDWDGCDNFGNQMGTGIYLYHLEVEGNYSCVKKMIIIK